MLLKRVFFILGNVCALNSEFYQRFYGVGVQFYLDNAQYGRESAVVRKKIETLRGDSAGVNINSSTKGFCLSVVYKAVLGKVNKVARLLWRWCEVDPIWVALRECGEKFALELTVDNSFHGFISFGGALQFDDKPCGREWVGAGGGALNSGKNSMKRRAHDDVST